MNDIYDLVVIGGGSAGLTAVNFGLESGARVALVEKNHIGGDCTWSGCVPSKSLLKAAKVAHHMRSGARFGLPEWSPNVDLKPVMARVHSVIAETYQEESPEALRAKGIDVYLGEAKFLDAHRLRVGEDELVARNIVIATGAHPFVPPIDGLAQVDYLTYETIWQLNVLPNRLIVVGAGPIGSEMSQAFARLGSQVTLIESGPRVLGRDDPEASAILGTIFEEEGIQLQLNTRAEHVWQDEQGIHLRSGEQVFDGDALLMVVGRRPNIEGMDLEKAGIAYSPGGIQVDNKLQTTQSHIYAAGDCVGGYQFTHLAGWQAFVATRNLLLPGSQRGILETVPWTTFTDPEVAHAGFTEAAARLKFGDAAIQITSWPMSKVDRARAEDDTRGLARLVHKRNGKVIGVTIVSERAGELIHEWIYALGGRLNPSTISSTMHVYPSFSRANVKAAGALLQKRYLGGKMGPVIRALGRFMIRVMRWRRPV